MSESDRVRGFCDTVYYLRKMGPGKGSSIVRFCLVNPSSLL